MFDPVVGSSEPATQTYRKHILIGVLVLGLVCAVLGVWFGLQDHDHDQTSSTSSAPTQSVSRTYPVAPTPQQIHFALDPGNSQGMTLQP
jgi:hypothetical protein